MKIAVPRETAEGERRVALNPQSAELLIKDGNDVLVQRGAGEGSFIADDEYASAGARLMSDAPALYGEAEMVVHVGRPTTEEIEFQRARSALVAPLQPLVNHDLVR